MSGPTPSRRMRLRAVPRVGAVPTTLAVTSALPLAVLFALNFVDQADSALIGVLAPEVKDAFGMSNTGFAFLLAANFLLLVTLSVYVGYLGDRIPRIRLVQLGAFVAGIGSVFTGAAAVLWLLWLARLINGAGIVVNGPIHKSLLADYYPPTERARVFGIHEAGTPAGSVVAPLLAGGLAAALSWRVPFIALGVPIVVCCLLALRLPEPVRGGTDRASEALEAELEPPVPFQRAVRMMAQSRTIRRTWFGLVFFGAGFLPLLTFFALFYADVFGAGPLARGVIGAVGSAGGLAGLLISGVIARRLLERGQFAAMQLILGASFVVGAALVVVFALQRTLVMAAVLGTLVPFVISFFPPISQTIVSMVAPPRVRSQAFGFGFLFLGVGALLTPIAGSVADRDGLRWGIIAFAPLLFIGGVIVASAYRFIARDAQRAVDTLRTAAEMRHRRLEAADEALLVCRGLSVSYGQVQVLFDVDFDVHRGEILALLGTNGAGKSTLLKAIAGVVNAESGMVFFDGEEVSSLTAWEAAARGIVLMPGGKSIFPTMSVRENLRMAAYLYRAEGVDDRIDEVLVTFPRLRERLETSAGDLSGGEQQMVSLAQALMARPSLLMIDELSLGLAPKIVGELIETVRRIHETGVTIVLVEQSVNVALTVAKRAYFMEKGEVRFTGPTEDLLNRPDILRAVFLQGAAAVS